MQAPRSASDKYFTGADDDERAASDDESAAASDDESAAASDDAPKASKRASARASAKRGAQVDDDSDDSDADEDAARDSDSEDEDDLDLDLDEGADIDAEEAADDLGGADSLGRNFGELSDSDDDSDDGDDDYLQKVSAGLRHNIVQDHHPELLSHNCEEVDAMAKTVRDATGRIVDPLHRSLPFITKYERARVIGERAKQLNAGAKAMVIVEPSVIDGYLIALKEFGEKKIPFIVRRPMPNGGVEYWRLADLEVL